MTEATTQQQTNLATHHADFALTAILAGLSRVHEHAPDRMARTQPIMIEALEIALRVHRRNAATPGQLRELEVLRGRMEGILG